MGIWFLFYESWRLCRINVPEYEVFVPHLRCNLVPSCFYIMMYTGLPISKPLSTVKSCVRKSWVHVFLKFVSNNSHLIRFLVYHFLKIFCYNLLFVFSNIVFDYQVSFLGVFWLYDWRSYVLKIWKVLPTIAVMISCISTLNKQ